MPVNRDVTCIQGRASNRQGRPSPEAATTACRLQGGGRGLRYSGQSCCYALERLVLWQIKIVAVLLILPLAPPCLWVVTLGCHIVSIFYHHASVTAVGCCSD